MKEVQFGELHSYQDLQLILASKEIGSPIIKQREIDIEGADGVLDLTEFFGGVNYGNRTLKFDFSTIVVPSQFLAQYTRINNALHGKKMQIVLDDDSAFFYYGRVLVSAFTNDKTVGQISIECECEPYKLKRAITQVSRTVNGTANVVLTNGKMKVVPTITTTASMTFVFGGISKAVSAGTFQIPELQLSEGSNTVQVTGNGTVTFSYREGDL